MSTDLARKLRRNATDPDARCGASCGHSGRRAGTSAVRFSSAPITPISPAKLVIEVDGDTHATDEAIAADAARDAYMESRGILILRFSNSDVMQNAEGVFDEVAGVLGAVLRTTNTPTPSLPARGREDLRHRASITIGTERAVPSSPSPLRGGIKGGGS